MKPGDLIYRVIRSKYDNKWYYCIYEVIKYYYKGVRRAYMEIAPIITYYEANHSSHTTINFPCFEEWDFAWRTPWDFISKDEFVAKKCINQKQKMKIKVTTKMRQSPDVEIDGVGITGMEYWERLKLFNEITNKIPELENWFEQFLFALCLQFGEELPDGDIYEFTYELEL